jgi:hypothetical protein
MSSLKQLQENFQRGILAGDDAILADLKDSAKEGRRTRFGVYRHAYVARLAEVLGGDYAELSAYLGDARFAKLAEAYVAAHPSDRRSVRDFGRYLPAFLRENADLAPFPELAELADLELALTDAFDGPDATPLRLEELAEIVPELWPRLVLQAHPTSHRLDFATNAAQIWSALHDEATPSKAECLPETQAILVWREETTARFRPLAPEEAMMWDEAARGTRFGVLCELVATHGGVDGAEIRAATYLKNWVGTGTLAGFRIG